MPNSRNVIKMDIFYVQTESQRSIQTHELKIVTLREERMGSFKPESSKIKGRSSRGRDCKMNQRNIQPKMWKRKHVLGIELCVQAQTKNTKRNTKMCRMAQLLRVRWWVHIIKLVIVRMDPFRNAICKFSKPYLLFQVL